MCNKLHYESHAIPEMGFGWKLFTLKKGSNILCSLCIPNAEYSKQYNYDYVKWNHHGYDYSSGFCFFLDRKTALKIKKLWDEPLKYMPNRRKTFLVKIKYRKGLGSHPETGFITNDFIPIIALCQEFECCSKKYKL